MQIDYQVLKAEVLTLYIYNVLTNQLKETADLKIKAKNG